MGVPGLWPFLEGSKERIALAKLASDTYSFDNRSPRGFRVGIDTSIWLYQVRAGQGGQNPELRTLYFRLCRLRYLGILPIFVLDGESRPFFKRRKKIQKAKFHIANMVRLIKLFGFPVWYAPGEAEAECALLKKKSIIDAVISEDVDCFIFGSELVIKDWGKDDEFKNTSTHVSVYNMENIVKNTHISQAGMLLIALMSCGDYDSIGIPNCGIKTAIDAAKAGFGDSLLTLIKNGSDLTEWKNQLEISLRTNANGYFSTKHPSLKLPKDFPNQDIIKFYINPITSSDLELRKKAAKIVWKWPIDVLALQEFVFMHFSWSGLPGIKKFILSLAPCYLVSLLKQGDYKQHKKSSDFQDGDSMENTNSIYFTNVKEYLKNIKNKEAKDIGINIECFRKHVSTDHSLEFRVSFYPFRLMDFDVDKYVQTLPDQMLIEKEIQSKEPTEAQEEAIDFDRKISVWVLEPYLDALKKREVHPWKNKTCKKTHTTKQLGKDQTGAIENYFKVSFKGSGGLKPLDTSPVVL
ncbi:hypothetical protein PORY_001186 [Pneumocystis oryctolagi]|uniref:Uncharacterized protein n=1 Tax=Pneumocystis oryctolagi TaxID=42067 RepID=A0ACB7CDQ9_9ASCO|nr:hypothetical protein PORY_001186 [Pneumocystis oryctolagi]